MGLHITDVSFVELESPDYNERLTNIQVAITLTGTPPYTTSNNNNGLVMTNQPGPVIYTQLNRYTSPREVTVSDADGLTGTFNVDTLQPINNILDYVPYTLIPSTAGPSNATLTQSLKNTSSYQHYVDRLIRVVDPETSYPLSDWTSITIDGTYDFLGLPLRYVNIEIKDQYNSNWKLYRAIEAPAPGDQITIIQDIAPVTLIGDLQNVVVSGKANYVDTFRLTYGDLTIETYPDKHSGYGVFSINELVPRFNEAYSVYADRDLFHNPKHDIITNSVDQIQTGTYKVEDAFGFIDSSLKYFIAGATEYGSDFNINDYICNPVTSAPVDQKFLSNWKGHYSLKTDDYAVSKFLNGNFVLGYSGTPGLNINNTHIAFVRYDLNESKHVWVDDDTWYLDFSRTNFIALANGGMDPYLNEKQSVPYGPMNFETAIIGGNVIDSNTSSVSTNFLLDANTSYYEVFLVKNDDGNITKGSQSLYIDLNKDGEGCKYGSTQFFFEDSLGCYNTFSFNNLNTKSYSIDRGTSASNVNSLDRTTGTFGYNVGDRGRKTNAVVKQEEHKAVSGWLNDQLSENLMDLYASGDVYVIKNGERFPCLITSKKVEQKNIKNNRLFNHTISYVMAYDINTNV